MIVEDDLLEIDEVFTASLELVNAVDADRVVLMPASAPVTIFDDDCEYKVDPLANTQASICQHGTVTNIISLYLY